MLTSQHFIIIIFEVLDGVLGVHDHSFDSLAPHPDPHRQHCIHAIAHSHTHGPQSLSPLIQSESQSRNKHLPSRKATDADAQQICNIPADMLLCSQACITLSLTHTDTWCELDTHTANTGIHARLQAQKDV